MTKDGHQIKRRKGGRPKGDPATVRWITIGVRVNATEWEALHRKAGFMGMSLAQWLRTAALSRQLPSPPVPTANLEAYRELLRLSVNTNQIAKAANEGRAIVSSGLLLSLRNEILNLQLALVGAEK